MQFSENWLRTLIDPQLDSEALGHALTMAGLEVEEARPAAPPFAGVVVARIVEAERHPGADKLKVCKVDAGQGELLQIVCGAPNAAVGMKVPLARVGASLPGIEIKAAKLRGVESFGMLCPARGLGLSEDHSGMMALPESAEIGRDVRDLLSLDDTLFTASQHFTRAEITVQASAMDNPDIFADSRSLEPPTMTFTRRLLLKIAPFLFVRGSASAADNPAAVWHGVSESRIADHGRVVDERCASSRAEREKEGEGQRQGWRRCHAAAVDGCATR